MEDWAKTDPAIRQPAEQKMQAAWGQWMSEHAKMIISTEAGGKTKRVTRYKTRNFLELDSVMAFSFRALVVARSMQRKALSRADP